MSYQKRPFLPYFLLSLLLAFLTHRAYVLYTLAPKADLTNLFSPLSFVLTNYVEAPYFYVDVTPLAILAALVGFFIGMIFYLQRKPTGTYRHGEEAGSARFATANELQGFKDQEPTNNMIFSKNAQIVVATYDSNHKSEFVSGKAIKQKRFGCGTSRGR